MYVFLMYIICLVIPISADDYMKIAQACDGRQAHLMCSDRETIQIKSAFYGRMDNVTCNDNKNSKAWDFSCSFYPVVVDVANRCHDKMAYCSVNASVGKHPDPCPGTPKYIKIQYKCKQVIKHFALICDYEEAYISCFQGQLLQVVDAFYGRWDMVTCARGGDWEAWNDSCYARNSLDMVKLRCREAGYHCLINASKFEDPCPGTPKYLRVDFKCDKKVELFMLSTGLNMSLKEILLASCLMLTFLKYVT